MSNFNTTEAAICLMQAMFPEDLFSFSLFDLTDESELLTGKKMSYWFVWVHVMKPYYDDS